MFVDTSGSLPNRTSEFLSPLLQVLDKSHAGWIIQAAFQKSALLSDRRWSRDRARHPPTPHSARRSSGTRARTAYKDLLEPDMFFTPELRLKSEDLGRVSAAHRPELRSPTGC